jgi:hypothetical protein
MNSSDFHPACGVVEVWDAVPKLEVPVEVLGELAKRVGAYNGEDQ